MASFTATANSSTTIGYTKYGSSSWSTGSSSGACQGAYQDTSASGSRVGIIVFNGCGAAVKGKIISRIVLSITSASAGSGSSSKVLTLHEANYQTLDRTVTGGEQVGDLLGTLQGKFYGNTNEYVLDEESNSALFEALRSYLQSGNSAVVLYNGETSSSSGYSSNFARVSSCTITVTYMDAVLWYNDNGVWRACAVWYRKNGTWRQCVPYFRKDGYWIQV